jgi:hypothetical protein
LPCLFNFEYLLFCSSPSTSLLPKKKCRIQTTDQEEKQYPDREKLDCKEPDRQKLGSSQKEPGSDFEEPKGLLDLPDEVLLKILGHLLPCTIHHRVALVIKYVFLEFNEIC